MAAAMPLVALERSAPAWRSRAEEEEEERWREKAAAVSDFLPFAERGREEEREERKRERGMPAAL